MRLPSLDETRKMLDEASAMNPGPWIDHSLHTARAARNIAAAAGNMDPEAAYVLGALHDIGRRAGKLQMRHILEGYLYLSAKGYDRPAGICLTHSFQLKDIRSYGNRSDCTDDEVRFVAEYIEKAEYDDYDRLIQLCDLVAMSDGFCLMEKRLVDAALRHGTTPYTCDKWKACFELKDYFEKQTGRPLYSMLPGAVENTFGITGT